MANASVVRNNASPGVTCGATHSRSRANTDPRGGYSREDRERLLVPQGVDEQELAHRTHIGREDGENSVFEEEFIKLVHPDSKGDGNGNN